MSCLVSIKCDMVCQVRAGKFYFWVWAVRDGVWFAIATILRSDVIQICVWIYYGIQILFL